MRKTLIALILVLPMVFVLVIFSSVNLVSLGVNIAVNGIRIVAEGADEDGTLLVDMAEKTEHVVRAEVSPENATEKGYSLVSAAPDVVEITKEGRLVPKKEGTAQITATSNDKSFTDTMSVVVVSSKPYDFDFSLKDETGEDLLKATEDGYEATLPAGTYTYSMAIYPMEYTQYTVKQETTETDIYAEIERGRNRIFLPFSGDVEFTVTVPGGVGGDVEKHVHLHVIKPDANSVLINGHAADGDSKIQLNLTEGTTRTRLFVECLGGKPTFECNSGNARLLDITGKNNRYILDIAIDANPEDGIAAIITAGSMDYMCIISFDAFSFAVFSDRTLEQTSEGRRVTLLTGNAATFYAAASEGAEDVVYTWKYSGAKEDFTIAEDGASAVINAAKGSDGGVLSVSASYGGKTFGPEEIKVSVINKISAVQIANKVNADLAECYTVAGMGYTDALKAVETVYPLNVYTYSTSGVGLAGEDIEYTVSDGSIAKVELRAGSPVLVPLGTGKVTVTAAWKGNAAFHTAVQGALTVNVVKDAVAVKNAPELIQAMEEKRPAVLTDNIKLGTDAAGNAFSLEQRNELLKTHRFKSTYNIEWYKYNTNKNPVYKETDAYLSYVLEFTNDVYGNGKSIDADNYTHAHDSTGAPLLDLYKGPLYFVNYKGGAATVAGQDNCAFLIRTDGIKLYGVNLLGCSDDSLMSAEGGYDLTNLNLTGTTLEINASCDIRNCRIRNGRNVVRAYGGNKDGNKYFIDSLSDNAAGVDGERIDVTIDGCILSQGREFILKAGANRALRAGSKNGNGQEPQLRDQSGKAYAEQDKSNRYGDGKLYEDPYFYSHYVLTDITLKDSVLETSGLFTVGIESNFAGSFLYDGSKSTYDTGDWEHSGGTSFAAVLRLEGDVRLYDWKDLALVDSSTLIESPVGALSAWLKLDIKAMLDYVSKKNASYTDVIETTSDGKQYVHGGIALYGGGRNYSAVDLAKLGKNLNDFMHLNVNIGVLEGGEGSLSQQGSLLPSAAGTHDFNFYMYGKNSQNNYVKQRNDEQKGLKYSGVAKVPAF